jgi:coniferyl-aldehyde dehydrogenase
LCFYIITSVQYKSIRYSALIIYGVFWGEENDMQDFNRHVKKLKQTFTDQKSAFLRNPNPTLKERLARLSCLEDLIVDNREIFRKSLAKDFGAHNPYLADLMETGPVLERVRYFKANLENWMKPRLVALGEHHGSSKGEINYLPKGVMGNIAPWNFPIESALIMCTDMLAAGNSVIIKPSELSPATAQAVEDAVAKHFSPDVLAVMQGDIKFGEAFAHMPWDHLTFTGSPRVGKLVMQAAATNLVPVTLELGGKNPAVFAPDGVTKELVKLFLSFRTLKSGQVCTSPDHVFVPEDQLAQWIDFAKEVWREAYPHYVGHNDATGIINEAHYLRNMNYIREAQSRGVEIVHLNEDQPDPKMRQIPITLIINPPEDLRCMTDEMFGPVIPVLSYSTIDMVMNRINMGPAPLASYLATHSADVAKAFVETVRSGGAAINNFGIQGGHVALPFGGFGASGHGCHSSHEGFLQYSHTKSVVYGAQDSVVHAVLDLPLSELTGYAAEGIFGASEEE